MKKRTIICVMIMILSGMFVSVNNVDAKAYKFKKSDIKSKVMLDDVSSLYVNENGKVQYIDYSMHTKNYYKMDRYIISEMKDKKISSFKGEVVNDDYVLNCVRVIDGNTITLQNNSGMVYIKKYNDKGKRVFSCKIKENDSEFFFEDTVWEDDDNIYYVYQYNTKKGYKYKICEINKKTKKVKCRNINSKSSNILNQIIIQNGYIYELLEKEINIYSLKGNKLSTIKLPEGETSLYNPEVDSEEYEYMTTHNLAINGKYLYYCNKNGVYRCNISNLKKNNKFKLFYDAGDDEYFGHDYKTEELFVKDKNTFYVKVGHSSDYAACADNDDTKYVKYTCKK